MKLSRISVLLVSLVFVGCSIGLRTQAANQVVVQSFAASPGNVVAGQPVTLSWSISPANARINILGIGSVASSGTTVVYPADDTTYTIEASRGNSTDTKTVSVIVSTALERDTQRMSDITNFEQTLNSYRTACGQYPMMLSVSSNNGCPAGMMYGTFLSIIPTNPLPGGATYVYTVLGLGSTYTLTFALEQGVMGYAAGIHTLSPAGIQ